MVPSIRSFQFEELKEDTQTEPSVDYISREEFEEFKKELIIMTKIKKLAEHIEEEICGAKEYAEKYVECKAK